MIFDRYYDFSIKSSTRSKRVHQGSAKKFRLTAEVLLPPRETVLNNYYNKLLVDGLVRYFTEIHFRNTIIITAEDTTPFPIENGEITRPKELESNHEEADVMMVSHMVHFASRNVTPISIVCEDTDVLVLAMHFYHSERITADFLMDSLKKSTKTKLSNRMLKL